MRSSCRRKAGRGQLDFLWSGIDIHDITFIDGTVYKTRSKENIYDATWLPTFDEIKADKRKFAESFYIQYCNTDPFSGKRLVETYGNDYVVQNPPQKPLTQEEMDVFKRGRNAKSYTSAKNASKSDYHYATGFEALMRYLYMTGQTSRMMSLIKAGLEN